MTQDVAVRDCTVVVSEEARSKVSQLSALVDSYFYTRPETPSDKRFLASPDSGKRKCGEFRVYEEDEYLQKRLAYSGWDVGDLRKRWKNSRQDTEALEILMDLTLLAGWEVRAILGIGDRVLPCSSEVNMASVWCDATRKPSQEERDWFKMEESY